MDLNPAELPSQMCSIYHRTTYKKNADGSWTCPASSGALEKANQLPIQLYFEKRKNTIADYILQQPIYQRCIESIPLARNTNQTVW
jgi:hypothetical protein